MKTKLYLVIWLFFDCDGYLEVSAPNKAAANPISCFINDCKINLYNRAFADLKEALVYSYKINLQQEFQLDIMRLAIILLEKISNKCENYF